MLPKDDNRRAKSTDEQKESIIDILEENYSHTIQRKCDLFFERHYIRTGRSTATRCFKNFHYTLKILRPIPERQLLRIDQKYFHRRNLLLCKYDMSVWSVAQRNWSHMNRSGFTFRAICHHIANVTYAIENHLSKWKRLVSQAGSKSADEFFNLLKHAAAT
ncbi:hypothetical protein RF11_11841 [Thelohanellus kitauei]|uniref:Uncharacterized protein n=1 Tax=Thelohanellus kitauei TaxID=669202 RepID=A0A0C2M7Z6_THEKT|nr:hypothetical protein RF11_11841 [Thelohanellus kitauei]